MRGRGLGITRRGMGALGASAHFDEAVAFFNAPHDLRQQRLELTELAGDRLTMRAALFSPDGAERLDGEARFASGDSSGPARLAEDLLARAAPSIAVHFTGRERP